MKYKLLLLSILFLSCQKEKAENGKLIEIDWEIYNGYHFERELFFTHQKDDNIKFLMDEKINLTDSIKKVGDKYLYTSRPSKVGFQKISGKILINNSSEISYYSNVYILPKIKPAVFNKKNATDIKLNMINEIEILAGLPLNQIELKSDNGKIYKKGENIYIVPSKLGKCKIFLKHILPEYQMKSDFQKFENIELNVVN